MSSAYQAQVNSSLNNAGSGLSNAGNKAQIAAQPGGCRMLLTNFFKKFQKQSARGLPTGFPVSAALGSVEELQWFQNNSNRNWHRLPEYVRWMQNNTNAFQNDAEYKGKTQKIVSAMLDAILCLTGSSSTPMGLSNFTNQAGTLGVVVDHLGQKLMSTVNPLNPAKITFTSSVGTIFCIPFIETIPQTTNKAICFPVLILPLSADNDSKQGTQFLYFTFQFDLSIFDSNPGPSSSVYVLRVSEYHNLVPLIDEIREDNSLSTNDKDEISKGILSMLGTAIASTTVSEFEGKYMNTILSFLSSKLCIPLAPAAAMNGSSDSFPSPGNEPLDVSFTGASSTNKIIFDITKISGQTPVFTWTARPEIKGYGLQVQVQKAYFGYDPSFTRASPPSNAASAAVGWFTANSITQDLAFVQRNVVPGSDDCFAKPVVFSVITDNIVFAVDESGPTAVLQVLDRQITLTPSDNSSPSVYPVFLRRSLQSAFTSKQLVYDASKGVQGNVTLANLAVFSGMNLPMVQALALTLVDEIARRSIPIYDPSVAMAKGPFTYYSALFTKSDRTWAYRASIRDLLAYFINAQSSTMQISISASSIGISDNQPLYILNSTGAIDVDDKPAVEVTEPDTSASSTVEKFSGGVNITMGLVQGSDMRILLNSFTATAGGGGSYASNVSASANYQNGNYNGQQLTSSSYMVSRLRADAAKQAPSKASKASKASSSSSSSMPPIVNARINPNSNANKAVVRNVVSRSLQNGK